MILIIVCLFILLLIAVYTDYRYGKIPNTLILTGFLIGILWLVFQEIIFGGQEKSLTESVLRLLQILIGKIPCVLIPFLFFYPFFSLGVLGAGDVKLFSMMGIYFSFYPLIINIFLAFLAAAILAVMKMLMQKSFLIGKEIHLALPIFAGVCIGAILKIGGVCL